MRVKFGNPTANYYHIENCKNITHRPDSDILLITTQRNDVYTVKCKSVEHANGLYDQVFIKGYIDVSDCEYSN